MNDSIKRISLDIHSTGSMETVNAKRGDTARKLIISLVDGGLPYIIGEDCRAVFTGKKPDRNVAFNDCTIKDNTIIYAFTEQTVAAEGRVNCEIKLYGADGKLITSPKFTINVFGTVYNEGDEIESTDEFNALTSLIADTQKAVKEAQEAIKAAQGMEASLYISNASGNPVVIDDAAEHPLVGLKLYGKTTQDGTPTPDAPVELVSVGDGGSITVKVTGENQAQSMTIATPNGLPGIPVASGGNYTDANGKRWICDEIDFARGVYVQRTKELALDGSENWKIYEYPTLYYGFFVDAVLEAKHSRTFALCNQFSVEKTVDNSVWIGVNNTNLYVITSEWYNKGLDAWKEHLSINPLHIIYPLATPIETPLSEEELTAYAALHTYRDHTTVSNDAGAYMELEYVMDAKKYIDSLVGSGTILPATVE